jgi:hypothetical protein
MPDWIRGRSVKPSSSDLVGSIPTPTIFRGGVVATRLALNQESLVRFQPPGLFSPLSPVLGGEGLGVRGFVSPVLRHVQSRDTVPLTPALSPEYRGEGEMRLDTPTGRATRLKPEWMWVRIPLQALRIVLVEQPGVLVSLSRRRSRVQIPPGTLLDFFLARYANWQSGQAQTLVSVGSNPSRANRGRVRKSVKRPS